MELMDVISTPVVNICDGLPNCSYRLHSTDAELLATKGVTPSSGTDQRHKDSCLESREAVPEFLIATIPKGQLQVLPRGIVYCHMA